MQKVNQNIKRHIQAYMNNGFSLESACRQVKAAHLGRLDHHIDAVAKEL